MTAAPSVLSAVERLAESWNATPDYAPTEYDRGRVEQRHEMTMQLLEVLAANKEVDTPEPSDAELSKLANDAHRRMVAGVEEDGGWYGFSHQRDAWESGYETGYRDALKPATEVDRVLDSDKVWRLRASAWEAGWSAGVAGGEKQNPCKPGGALYDMLHSTSDD